jgi:hypothetical protein
MATENSRVSTKCVSLSDMLLAFADVSDLNQRPAELNATSNPFVIGRLPTFWCANGRSSGGEDKFGEPNQNAAAGGSALSSLVAWTCGNW